MVISSPSAAQCTSSLKFRLASCTVTVFIREFYWQSGSKANGGVDFDQLLVVGQLAERRGDADFFGHKI
jgi:hypothetical protein